MKLTQANLRNPIEEIELLSKQIATFFTDSYGVPADEAAWAVQHTVHVCRTQDEPLNDIRIADLLLEFLTKCVTGRFKAPITLMQ